ncbi:peptidase C15 [Brunnivagina elsteri]|uniref:Peptidase C15 n=1 Tax=Brunnivagina elsteri CCALA 953 TaxID=987040 RepID=A0A2A2TEQ7_9CYAN|nr:peptidase C15 [Calothrix elsteri]PAX52181.1 peptidase C15 [Calothrix elsteri CCALA 953]
MTKRFILTSFDIWLPHHTSNSSDDLLELVNKVNFVPNDLIFLRKLPVDVKTASAKVITQIDETQPDYIICCGMAESRSKLSVESNARSTVHIGEDWNESILRTSIDLDNLVRQSTALEISHNCGRFVCEGLYYSVLNYLNLHSQFHPNKSSCIFIHVPILTKDNLSVVLEGFLSIIHCLALSPS